MRPALFGAPRQCRGEVDDRVDLELFLDRFVAIDVWQATNVMALKTDGWARCGIVGCRRRAAATRSAGTSLSAENHRPRSFRPAGRSAAEIRFSHLATARPLFSLPTIPSGLFACRSPADKQNESCPENRARSFEYYKYVAPPSRRAQNPEIMRSRVHGLYPAVFSRRTQKTGTGGVSLQILARELRLLIAVWGSVATCCRPGGGWLKASSSSWPVTRKAAACPPHDLGRA